MEQTRARSNSIGRSFSLDFPVLRIRRYACVMRPAPRFVRVAAQLYTRGRNR
jgi:hypothetical protein